MNMQYTRQAHNLKVVGSNPTPATNFEGFPVTETPFLLVFLDIFLNPALSGTFRRQREIVCESLNLFTLCSQQIRFVHLK